LANIVAAASRAASKPDVSTLTPGRAPRVFEKPHSTGHMPSHGYYCMINLPIGADIPNS